MKIKVCFENETHRISKLPETFEALSQLISSIFLSTIPESWRLEYIDSDGDKIMLADEQDYKEFLDSELKDSNGDASVKVFIVPYDETSNSQLMKVEEIKQIPTENKDDDYNIIKTSSEVSSERSPEEGDLLPSFSDVTSGSDQQEIIIEEKQKNVEIKKGLIEVEKEKIEIENIVKEELQSTESNPSKVIGSVLKTQEKEEEEKNLNLKQQVPSQKPKTIPKKMPKPQPKPKIEKPKDCKSKLSMKKVFIKNQVLDKMVQDAVQRNISQIAMMTSSYLNSKTANTQTQTQAQVQEKLQEQIPVVHRGVRCDGCNSYPLAGIRYKCSVCPDYDYCEHCEKDKEHPHAFIKIKFPGHAFGHRIHSHFPPSFHQPIFPHPSFHQPPFNPLENPKPCKILFKQKQDSPAQASQLTEETLDSLKQAQLIQGIDSVSMTTSQIISIAEKSSKKQEEPEKKMPLEEKKEEIEKNEIVEEEPEVNKVTGAPVYSKTAQDKALQLLELLPEVNLDVLLSFVDNAPEDLDLAELMENFRH